MTFDERWKAILDGQITPLIQDADQAEAAREDAEGKLAAEKSLHEATRLTLAAEQKKYNDHMATHSTTNPPPNPTGGKVSSLVAVRVFPHYTNKNYGEHDRVLKLLGELGIKRISGLLGPGSANQVGSFYKKAYEQHGIKTWFTVGAPRDVLTEAQWKTISDALTSGKQFIELVSGWNEPNHVRGGGTLPADWPALTINHQKRLFEIARPLGMAVGTAQLWSGKFAQHEADLKKIAAGMKQYSTDTSWHLYPRGTVGKDLVDGFYTLYESQLGKRPVTCTEAGYFTVDPAQNDTGAIPVTEAQQAEYLPKHVRLYTDKGDRISIFELLDDPAGGREGTLGLVRADWTKKPAFNALKAMVTA